MISPAVLSSYGFIWKQLSSCTTNKGHHSFITLVSFAAPVAEWLRAQIFHYPA